MISDDKFVSLFAVHSGCVDGFMELFYFGIEIDLFMEPAVIGQGSFCCRIESFAEIFR